MSLDVSHDGSSGDGSGGSAAKPAAGSDVVLIHGVTEDGKGLNVLRARNQRVELGQVRPLEEGKPLVGDLVRLKPRPGAPHVCDVETELEVKTNRARAKRSSPASAAAAEPASRRHGPPQVASDAYRRNWDAIWKSSESKPKLPN